MRAYANRKDSNHADVVAAFRAAGCLVVDVSNVACGCDLFVWSRQSGWMPFEIKDGEKPPSARRLTETEIALQQQCRAAGAPYVIVLSCDEAVKLTGGNSR